MKKRCFFPLIALVLLSLSALAADTVDDVRPQVNVVFHENVVLITYFLKNVDTGKIIDLTVVSGPDGKTFSFTPASALSNGMHQITVYASDLVGNRNSYTYDFDVFVPGTTIKLTKPSSIGVSNTTKFTVGIYTSRPSVCKYTGISVPAFDDVRLKYFDLTGGNSSGSLVNEHEIYDFSVEPEFPRNLFVICRDDLGRENTGSFTIYSDITPPTITSTSFNPSPVVEYPDEGNLSSVLAVDASEAVICRYTADENASYDRMAAFSGFDSSDFDAFKSSNSEKIYFPSDVLKKTYTFYVQCEDRARLLSGKVSKTVAVDLTEGLKIQFISPAAMSRNTSVFLNVKTSRNAYCVYKGTAAGRGDPVSYTDAAARLSSFFANLSTTHTKALGTRSTGQYSISVRCDVPEGVGAEPLTAEATHTFIIDTTPPSAPKVNATTPVCSNTLSAKFTANDTQSGISEYRWAVGYSGAAMANGSSSSGSASVSKSNNGSSFVLSDAVSYAFTVVAVDGAGNVGPPGTSNPVKYDSTGVTCDKTPPTITVEMASTGDTVYLKCTDDKSGCESLGSYYGTSYAQPCNSTQYFLEPIIIPLFRSTVVCWDVKDKAGNYARGSKVVNLGANATGYNISGVPGASAACASGIDNDGDGYGENCLLGFDCDDTDPNMNVGCSNGCIQDTDGDGFGIGCIKGNDCDGTDPKLNTVCPNGCISDNDGDKYGLGCVNGPDCKGDDSTLQVNCPNGCLDDNDGDSYGLGCPVGFDCQGEDLNKMTECGNGCVQDTDGDSFGMVCSAGLDCNGRHPYYSVGNCTNGCYFDEDGDSYGFGCYAGLDCNGADPFNYRGCSNNCVSDNDGDGYGWKCDNGADCNDTNPGINIDCTETTDCVYDHDGDGYGLGCEIGADCDEYDLLSIDANCTANCTYDADCNALPDEWQERYFNNTICDDESVCGPDADPDGDGYTNIDEYRRGTDPTSRDELSIGEDIQKTESTDEDGDGMPDACEKLYGLNPSDPYDSDKDSDNDGLTNREECAYTSGMCTNSLDPTSADTDNDGYGDKEEVDAGTDPCDPDSMPSKGWIGILMMVLGILANTGSAGYLIYKKYYIPLAFPQQKPAAVPGMAARSAGVPPPGVHIAPRRMPPKKPSGPAMSRELFEEELKKRADEREKILNVFGERRLIPKEETPPKRVMEEIARRPAESGRIAVEKPKSRSAAVEKPDYFRKLSSVVGEDYFDKVSDLTKKEANYLEKLAVISKEKSISLEEDHISKLANITREVSGDSGRKRELEDAFRSSEMDKLDSFLTSRKKVDTFIKESPAEGGSRKETHEDAFAALGKIGEEEAKEALSGLPKSKRDDVMRSLTELSSKKERDAAMARIESLSGAESKDEIFKAFKQMSKDRKVDKNVFEVLLSYLMKSGKISRQDVSEILFSLESQGVLDKKDVAEVFFNLGIRK
jgi:hypothetical protein